jgi:hypothetical protein
MKTYPLAALVISLLQSGAPAQTAQPPTTVNKPELSLVVQINNDLNANKVKTGDKVSAKVIQDVVSEGRIVIPRDSRVLGHIADVTPFHKDDPRSRLALLFERVEVKGSGSLPIHGVVQAIAPPLPDPFLEAIMASSSSAYGGGQNGHPVNGGLSTGQTNTPTPIITSARSKTAAGALEQREQALNNASVHGPETGTRQGALTADSHGVFGLPGLALSSGSPIPVIVTAGRNIELKPGTQIVIRLENPTTPP